jgi:dihydrofolate synthase / folylpolyglutamate synthase
LLRELGDPQDAFRAVHIVGTNGKSTTTRMIEELVRAQGILSGSTISPHVESWSERIRVDCAEVDLEVALARVHEAARASGATQFETVIAAAFAEFAARGVSVAAVEAGLGGRFDATNVLGDVAVVVLTNVGLDHTDVLGATRDAIAAEKLAVVRSGCSVVIGEPEWERAAWSAGAGAVMVQSGGSVALAGAAVDALVGHAVARGPASIVSLPGRFERRPGEIRDGAHNPDGVRYLVDRLPRTDYVVVAAILADKDADGMLRELARAGGTMIATTSASPRALPAAELARLAERWFESVETEVDPVRAVARGHELADVVLVTGSLTLLADLAQREAASR